MIIDPADIKELKHICADSFQKELSDLEAQEVAQRIIRFLRHFIPKQSAQSTSVDSE